MADEHRILIVEDDLDLSEMLSSYFRVQNYEVLTAAWAEDAIKTANDTPPDLIMLDIRLPDKSGYDVCRELRENRKTQDIPIIFLTEKSDRVDKLQGLELGVVDYITKPFDIQELRLRVRNAINRAEQSPVSNPVTKLPEGAIVDERLANTLKREDDWAILQFSISSLGTFRERYGFVAADDVLRAVTLMVQNAVKEDGESDNFVGHLEDEDFIIITQAEHVKDIRDRIERRVQQSREYFYPIKDHDKAKKAIEENQLQLSSGFISKSTKTFESVDDLKKALKEALKPE